MERQGGKKRQVWRETKQGLERGRGERHVEDLFDGGGTREEEEGQSFSESDCTLRRWVNQPKEQTRAMQTTLQLQKQQ